MENEDEPVRTMKLERPIYDGAEIHELEFYEPTGRLMRQLEEARSRNAIAKKSSDFRSETFVVLAHVTRLHVSALEKMTFSDLQDASEIAVEICGLDDDDDETEGAEKKS